MQQPTPGHRKITLQTNVPSEAVRWETDSSEHAGQLYSLIEDLTFIVACCGRLLALHVDVDRSGDVKDEVAVQAYWGSAIVAYGRCFDSAGRLVLTEDDASAAGMLDEHRRFMDMRNLHVAHQIDPHWERSGMVVMLTPRAGPVREVIGPAWLAVKHISGQPPEIESLRSLALALREPLQQAHDKAMAAVLEEAKARPIEDLYALPGSMTPDVETNAMRSLPRRRQGKKR